jgi:hypothetical protein
MSNEGYGMNRKNICTEEETMSVGLFFEIKFQLLAAAAPLSSPIQ